jgi:Undecaprenyl-phosphate galactose phosphotransferase WbaP
MSTHIPADYLAQPQQTVSQKTTESWNARTVGKHTDAICRGALLTSDALSFVFALCPVWGILALSCGRMLDCSMPSPLAATATGAGLIFIGVCVYLASHGHFRERLPFWHEVRDVVTVSAAAFCWNIVLAVTAHHKSYVIAFAFVWLLFPLTTMALRQATKRVLSAIGLWQVPVVVLGDQTNVADAVRLLSLERLCGYKVVGSLHPSLIVDSSFAVRCRTTLDQLSARRIVVPWGLHADIDCSNLRSIVRARIPLSILPQSTPLPVLGDFKSPIFGHDAMMISYRDNIAQRGSRLMKVSIDFISSLLAVASLVPVFLVVAMLIRRDGGDAFFGHRRMGAAGDAFSCLKFRTMIMNSREVLSELLARDPVAAAEWADTQKLADDPRITRVGKFLRATSLDELPQLLNVLKREMSLVGPRPIVEQEVMRYADDIDYYYQTKPGLTGLWQVSGRSDTSYKQRVQLDSWYVRNWSLWHDVAILAKTVPAVLMQQGAC